MDALDPPPARSSSDEPPARTTSFRDRPSGAARGGAGQGAGDVLNFVRRITSSEAALSFFGWLLASHYRLVGWTTTRVRVPDADFYEPFEENRAVIIALWHGEHFLMPFFGWRKEKLNILMTTHRDGEVLARGCGHFGLRCIRGSGGDGREFVRKKAVQAFSAMLRALRRDESVVLTADVPKVARVAGLGIALLAKHSGCPIVPVAMATTRRYRLSNWDRTCINLPFGRMAAVRGEPIFVARDADETAFEKARLAVETSLNEVTAHAYQLVDSGRARERGRAARSARVAG
jgi:hypothetical protein